jgi:hypothetical protein
MAQKLSLKNIGAGISQIARRKGSKAPAPAKPITAAQRASFAAAGALMMGRAAPTARAALSRVATIARAAPVARAAAIARVAPIARAAAAAPPPEDAPGGDGPYADEAPDPYGQDSGGEPVSPPPDDPSVELPDGYMAPGADDGAPGADMAGLDYHQALAGLGDWQTDLKNFAETAAINVGKQALTTIGGKLAPKPAAPPPPPPSMFASPVVKVALGAGALAAVYLLVSRRSSPAPAAA